MLTDFDTPTDEGNNKEIKENNPPKTSAFNNKNFKYFILKSALFSF
jgi:hypothetical protein